MQSTCTIPRQNRRWHSAVPAHLHPCQEVREPTTDEFLDEIVHTKKFAIYGFLPLASIAVPPPLAPSISLPDRGQCPTEISHPLPPHAPPSPPAMTHRPSPPQPTFSASMPPRVRNKPDIGLKRGVSVPDMSPHSQVSSEPFPSAKRARTSHGPTVQTANLSFQESYTPRLTPPSPANRSISSPGDIHFPEKTKDAVRKFHALKELLSTEVGYLIDLRIFVAIYLRHLSALTSRSPTTSTFRSSMSFTAGPWITSYSHLQAATMPPSETSAIQRATRSVLSDNEIETLSRNAEDILQLHEEFVDGLREGLSSLGFSMDTDESDEHQQEGVENIESAIRVVTAMFISKASLFKRYESFCAGHPEALEVVRKTLQQHGAAWEAYSQRCSVLVADLLVDSGAPAATEDSASVPILPEQIPLANARRRAISLTSSDATIRPLRRRISGVLSKDALVFPAERRGGRRIEFMDYMIKPVQRICRYPLLLDQLKPSKTLRLGPQWGFEALSDVDELVNAAAKAMRDVAACVDEARYRQDIATRSSLVISRIYMSGSLMTSSARNPTAQGLTLDFFSSLGNCVFAGSVDVLHHHPLVALDRCSTLTAKYLGAFLYPGGYLILAKISKGKKYEPKHWFPLVGFELEQVEDEEAMLAFSFRLSSEEQVYELGTGCQREKVAWMSAIREASSQTATWVNEPTPSFRFDSKGEYIGDGELKTGPETANNTDNEYSEHITIRRRHTRMKRKPWRADTMSRAERPLTSGSMKAMFTPITTDDEDIELRRPATMARSQVDQDLQDVLSQVCLNARSYAFSREEELFPPPVSTRIPLPRSNSTMSISGMAKTRLTRYDSVRIPKRKSTLEGSDVPKAMTIGSRRKAKRLSLSSLPAKELVNPMELYPTPPSSQSSSTAPSFVLPYDFVKTASASPAASSIPNSSSSPALTRRGSLVQNMKEFFRPNLSRHNHSQGLLEIIRKKSTRVVAREVHVQ